MINIGVIVLNWNRSRDTLSCLESLKNMNINPDIKLKIYVVDNGSEECSPEIFKEKYPEIELLLNDSNLGYTGGNNVGMKRAMAESCKYVVLLNNDTEVCPELVNELVNVAETDDKIGIVAPKSKFFNDPGKIQYAGGNMNLNFGRSIHIGYLEEDRGQYDLRTETGFCTGACILLRSEMLDKIGLLNEDYFMYHDDSEICMRAVRVGYKLFYTGKTYILHKESPSLGGYMNPLSFYYSIRNSFYLVRKYGSIFEKINYTLYLLLFYWFGVLGYSLLRRQPKILFYFCKACSDFLHSRQGKIRKP